MRYQSIFLTAILVLSGCGSGVKLDNVPVEDRNGAQVSPNQSGAASNASTAGVGTVSQSGVTPVKLGPTETANSQNLSKIIYFDYDSVAVKPEFQALIESHAKLVRADKAKKVQIEGHTDERGGREYNLALGQRRAEAVRKVLELLGVAETQIEAVSFGKEKPAAEGVDEASLAKNRRAEITYR